MQALQQAQPPANPAHSHPGQQACEQGFTLLQAAENDALNHKALLQQAGQLFSQTLQAHPGCVEAYLGMAELFIRVQRKQKAQEYLLQARKIEPNHPDVKRLMQLLQTKTPVLTEAEKAINLAENLERWLMSSHNPQNSTDFEELYHKTEQFLKAYIRGLSYQTDPLKSGDPTHIQKHHTNLTRIHTQVQAIFKWLEPEFDLHALTLLLQPYDRLRLHCQRLLEQDGEIKRLNESIENSFTQVAHIHDLLIFCPGPEEIQRAESLLEPLLDRCDALADQLDRLEQNGQGSPGVLKNYEKLILVVESLCDQIDGYNEEIKAQG